MYLAVWRAVGSKLRLSRSVLKDVSTSHQLLLYYAFTLALVLNLPNHNSCTQISSSIVPRGCISMILSRLHLSTQAGGYVLTISTCNLYTFWITIQVYIKKCVETAVLAPKLKYPSVILHRNIIRSNGCVQAKQRGSSTAVSRDPQNVTGLGGEGGGVIIRWYSIWIYMYMKIQWVYLLLPIPNIRGKPSNCLLRQT